MTDQINAALNKAADELPDGYSIRIEIERGAGWVEWIDPDTEHHIIDSEESGMNEDIEEALAAALNHAEAARGAA